MNRRVLLTDIKTVTLVEEERQVINENEVRVAIKAAGICGSDLHYFRHGGLGSHKQPLPMQMGHEPAGVVVESQSKHFKVGDRVAIEPSNPDLSDKWSLSGRHNLASGTFMGANASGCMTDEVVVHDSQCVSIPDNMSYGAASLLEPVAVGFHAINRSRVSYQDSVTIFGCGPVGLCLLLCLKRIGVTDIYCVDPLQHRRDAAHAHGSYSDIGYAGTIGDVGCFSFFPTKVMTTGEGGMVTTNNDLLANVVRSLKNFGRDNNDASRCIITQGMNSKINDLTGLLGSLECDRVLDRVQRRNSLLEIYKSNLNSNFKVVTQDGGRCCYYKCIAITENADAVRDAMRKNNITPTGEVYS